MPDLQSNDKLKQFEQSLGDQVGNIEQEARMVLPGIQAIFGFQLVAVFSQGFKAYLSQSEQIVHLAALILMAISAILVMAPAAYHRQAHHQISKHFVEMSGNFLAVAMVPLALGSCMDIFLIARVIVQSRLVSGLITGSLFLVYAWTWFIFPRLRAKKIEDLPVHTASEVAGPQKR